MKRAFIITLLSLATASAFAQTEDASNSATNHEVCKRDPNMPANAKPAWPKSAYTPTQDPSCAPCYTYTRKSGLKVMECPFLLFPPEHRNSKEVSMQTSNGNLNVQSGKTYTGHYSATCKRDPLAPKGAKPAWPKSEYIPVGNTACAPCYEYTTKRGLKVMECHNALFPAEKRD